MTKQSLLAPFRLIRVKTSLFVLGLLIITTIVFYLVTLRIMNHRIMDEIVKRSESLSRSIASTAGYSLFSEDILSLDNLVYKIKTSNPDIEYIAVISTDNTILVHSEVKKTGEKFSPSEGTVIGRSHEGTIIKEYKSEIGGAFEITSPIQFMERPLGMVILSVNRSVLFKAQEETRDRIALSFAIILLLGISSSLLLSSLLTKPIQELSVGVTELKEGKRSRPLRIYSQDELGRLTQSFNEMTSLITVQRDRLSKYAQDLEEAYVSTVRVLAAAIDARDNYTLGHSTRVAQLSVELGRMAGLRKEDLEDLEVACLFHDVGKIRIPDSILLKKGQLDPHEHREMTMHSEYGAEILSKAPSLFKYIPAVRHHHEWYDGKGYPDGLSGDKIPLPAAIISLADVYDALISDRPYRDALSKEDARRKIADLAGKQFHPELAKAFIRILEKRSEEPSTIAQK